MDSNFRIAAVTMCRGDQYFLEKWISYYGNVLGKENLYIMLDGLDEPMPCNGEGCHIKRIQHKTLSRAKGDKYRIGLMNHLAKQLFEAGYKAVIGTDCDEFIVVDPKEKNTLATFVYKLYKAGYKTASALGIDIGQKVGQEMELDKSRPILSQRSYGVISARYTKASIKFTPERNWGSGFHRIKGHNYNIVPSLYLLHMGYACRSLLGKRCSDETRLAGGWKKHLGRRGRTIAYVTENKVRNANKVLPQARFWESILRKPYALNKPLFPFTGYVIELPHWVKQLTI